MECIESVSYELLVNGTPQDPFKPSRGIRQGDPISPYLFIMCAEALSNLICQAEAKGQVHGIPIAKGQLKISHLFFADDSLLFCKANTFEWIRLHGLLKIYEQASGKRLNLKKTSILFSKNITRATQNFILFIAGVRSAMTYEKYLGLPYVVGKNKNKTFKGILDSIRLRLSNHKVKLLSLAGKEIYIKVVIQALPTYAMSVFKLPCSLLNEISRATHNFWWGQ
ncbi:uncharacterized protein LOC122278591 [Carya illinoinensis]|uniref:uncharacterized protein LOC122278591 n=1 Tax=Carya illinoinensis TaxID=32201 RepID=UPI001C728F3D|nr:uncharacterized protein LOC122278591 [Carya illinoinensis]